MTHIFPQNAIFNDQSFNDTLTNDIVSFEQLGQGLLDQIKARSLKYRLLLFSQIKVKIQVAAFNARRHVLYLVITCMPFNFQSPCPPKSLFSLYKVVT